MLFVYGRGNTLLTTAPLTGVACAHCGQVDTLSCSVFARYASLFWIPILPLGKTAVTVCRHCKQTLTGREVPTAYRPQTEALERQAKVPPTHYAVLVLLGLLIAYTTVVALVGPGRRDDQPAAAQPASAALGSRPVVGSLYRAAVDDGRDYMLVRVQRVTDDSVAVLRTQALRGPLTQASADRAFRDSLDQALPRQQLTRSQWHYSTTGEGLMRPVSPAELGH